MRRIIRVGPRGGKIVGETVGKDGKRRPEYQRQEEMHLGDKPRQLEFDDLLRQARSEPDSPPRPMAVVVQGNKRVQLPAPERRMGNPYNPGTPAAAQFERGREMAQHLAEAADVGPDPAEEEARERLRSAEPDAVDGILREAGPLLRPEPYRRAKVAQQVAETNIALLAKAKGLDAEEARKQSPFWSGAWYAADTAARAEELGMRRTGYAKRVTDGLRAEWAEAQRREAEAAAAAEAAEVAARVTPKPEPPRAQPELALAPPPSPGKPAERPSFEDWTKQRDAEGKERARKRHEEREKALNARPIDRMFTITVDNLERLQDKIASINKRAHKLGLPEMTVEEIPDTRRLETAWISDTHRQLDDPAGKVSRVVCDVRLLGEVPRLKGWAFIGAIERYGDEVLTRSVPGERIPAAILAHPDPSRCDHCRTSRNRNKTYVLRSDKTQEHRVVGSTCLGDFTGANDPEGAIQGMTLWAALADLVGDFMQADDDEWSEMQEGKRAPRAFDLTTFLAHVVASINKHGWVSRQPDAEGTATADRAWMRLTPPKGEPAAKLEASDTDTAAKIAEWAKAKWHDADPDRLSSFEANLRAIVRAGYVEQRATGLAAAIVRAYQRERASESQAKAAERVGHWGKIGARQNTDAEIVDYKPMPGQRRGEDKALVTMQTPDGHLLKWWASNPPEQVKVPGARLAITATPTRHGEFRGTKETTVSSVTVNGRAAGAPSPAEGHPRNAADTAEALEAHGATKITRVGDGFVARFFDTPASVDFVIESFPRKPGQWESLVTVHDKGAADTKKSTNRLIASADGDIGGDPMRFENVNDAVRAMRAAVARDAVTPIKPMDTVVSVPPEAMRARHAAEGFSVPSKWSHQGETWSDRIAPNGRRYTIRSRTAATSSHVPEHHEWTHSVTVSNGKYGGDVNVRRDGTAGDEPGRWANGRTTYVSLDDALRAAREHEKQNPHPVAD